MTKLLVKNGKMAKSGSDKVTVYNFGLPAFESADGTKTCPMAGTCAKGCYAKQGSYVWPVVQNAYEYRLAATRRESFAEELAKELAPKLAKAEREQKQLVVRIHDSGDFYSPGYVREWLWIMLSWPEVKFYAYTKNVPLFKRLQGQLPDNFTIIFSEGGKADWLIEEGDRHARVFESEAELVAAGYDNAMDNDNVAWQSQSGKIGLYYHGAKSKQWSTR